MRSRLPSLGGFLIGAIGFSILWYFRPWLHGIVHGIYTNPWVLLPLAIVVFFTFVGYVEGGSSSDGFTIGIAISAVLLLVLAPIAGAYAGEAMANIVESDIQETERLPEVDTDRPRILPEQVASRYADNSLNYPKYRVTKAEVTFRGGTPTWSYALAPDGFRNHFVLRQLGAVYVDMDRHEKNITVVENEMNKGVGVAFYNHHRWKLLKTQEYLVDYKDPFMVPHEGEAYIAVPYTKPNFHFRGLPIPMIYTTPEWGGVMLIDSDGNIEDLSPEEAANHPVLEGQKLVPYDLTRYKVDSMRYKNGIVNTLPIVGAHNEELQLAKVPGKGNNQPFTVPTEDGIDYFVAVEPHGQAQGVYQVWVVDGRTEEYQVYNIGHDDSLLGPRKAADYVRKDRPQVQWADPKADSPSGFYPSEPIPAVVNDTLYWQFRVIPRDGSGVSYTAFVDAHSGNIYTEETTDGVKAFLREGAEDNQRSGDSQTTTEQPSEGIQLVIRDSNGEVVEVVDLDSGYTLEIQNTTDS